MMLGDPQWCLRSPEGLGFCYAPPVTVLVRAGDGFSTPVCEAHIEVAQKVIRGKVPARADRGVARAAAAEPGRERVGWELS